MQTLKQIGRLALLVALLNAGNVLAAERKERKQAQASQAQSQKNSTIAPTRFAVHDRGLQWLMMRNNGELSNPDDRPPGPPTPFHPSSSQRTSKLEYPGDTGTRFLFSGGLWVGAIKDGVRIVSTVTDGDDGTNEFGPLSTWLFQSTQMGQKGIDDDGDWTPANDRDGNSLPSADWDGPDADANGDGLRAYDPEAGIDEDPVGDIANDFLDNDFDGRIDGDDPDQDGDQVPGALDDDGDGEEDEDILAFAGQEWYTAYVDTCSSCISSPDLDGFTPLGVRVVQHTLQWSESFRDDFLIAEFLVTNIGASTLENVWLGTFFDFDVQNDAQGRPGSEDDITFLIDSLQTAIGGDDDSDGLDSQFFGVRVLKTPQPNASISYLNFSRLTGGGDPNDNLEKYVKMSSGVRDPDQFVPSDWRLLFSFGPLGDLGPGETLPVALAIVNGRDLNAIIANSRQAYDFYQDAFTPPPLPGRKISVTPALANFGSVEVGQRSRAASIVISNLGADTLTVSAITHNSPAFEINGVPTLPRALPFFGSIGLSVRFVPTSPGVFTDALRIQSNDPNTPSLTIPLSGLALGLATLSGVARDTLSNLPIRATLEFLRMGDTEPRAIVNTNADGSYSVTLAEGTYEVAFKPEIPYPEIHLAGLNHTLQGTVRDFLLKPAPFALVEDDSGGVAGMTFRNVLSSLGYSLAVWNILEKGATVPADRLHLLAEPRILLWATGSTSTEVLNDADRAAIIGHLEDGNKLILTGENIAETSPGQDSLLAHYLGVEFKSNRTFQPLIRGFPSDPIGDGLSFLVSPTSSSKDVLQRAHPTESKVHIVFSFFGDTTNIAAIRAQGERPNWRAVYFGFRLENVSSNTLTNITERTIDWLSDTTTVSVEEERAGDLPLAFRLEQNYPNPFNPQTTIAYELPKASLVTLKVYNSLGQEVAMLVNAKKAAGRYKVEFAARDLPNGVYVYELRAGEFTRARKLVVLK